MQSTGYYQIGGFRGHFRDAPQTISGKLRAREEGIDLVLGIEPSGASYLLMSSGTLRHEMDRRDWPRGEPWPASRFASLSPIHFANRAALEKKLYTLMSKKAKKGQDPRDRSKANSRYSTLGESSPEGRARASFEHQRLFVALRLKELRERAFSEYALRPASWMHDTEIVSFVYNTWSADARTLDERERSPKLLDIAWADWAWAIDTRELKASTTTHLLVQENRFLSNPGMRRLNFDYGVTETVDEKIVRARLQQLFNPEDREHKPKILLVHDAEKTCTLLQAFGVNIIQWEKGLRNLLYCNSLGRHDSRDPRALSPFRQLGRDPRPRPRSPPRSRAPVYVVDVRQLYQRMKQIEQSSDTVAANAEDLRVQDHPESHAKPETSATPISTNIQKGWCAGNESRLLARMWFSMARGPTIDEQRELRWTSGLVKIKDEVDKPKADDPGSDFDPNDMMAPQGQSSSAAQDPGNIYANEDEDDDW